MYKGHLPVFLIRGAKATGLVMGWRFLGIRHERSCLYAVEVVWITFGICKYDEGDIWYWPVVWWG
jgi:hypothetical protein